MTHASLFSGIGGAEIAASWLGWQNLFHCEIQEFQRKVLEYWFPNSISYEDITKTDFSEWRGHINVLTGGFPCQPFSVAGKRKGAEDNRYLWGEMLRAIREIQPAWVVGENVNGLLSMVQPGEEVKMGRTDDLFEENYIYRTEQQFTIDAICEDLAHAGYSVQPLIIPACAVGAPHRRDRVWIVARLNSDADCQRCAGRGSQTHKREKASKRASVFRNIERPCGVQDVANSANARAEGLQQGRKDRISEFGVIAHAKGARGARELFGKQEQIQSDRQNCRIDKSDFRCFPTQPPICSRDDGISIRLANLTISFAKWRRKSIEALGNAWVPQVAYEIFKAIVNYDKMQKPKD
ncbi:DNA cytosine methyltransferase [Alloprevotella tannerae]|uniref:Cytosine-specific methyltransferase n=1 Tax=Alloprevotella tannerae TaxID=76122 RepID=A0A929WZ65_9BACT|nr:DNA (cytosine-5-)-methyltransferase [Alloprevotella tannerae]MBF0969493.1 DNA cytosine methyltransferase [Alloprevotella tannerae]